eukprot:7352-Heterococcus_DN1.PRE.1
MDKNTTVPSKGMTSESAATDVEDDVPDKSNVAADVDTTMPDTITAATSDNSSSSNGISRSSASTGSTRLLPARLRQAPVAFVPTFQGSFVRRRPGSATDATVTHEEDANDSGNSSNNSNSQPYAAAQQRSQLRAPQRSRQLRGNNSTATATSSGAAASAATTAAATNATATVDTDVSDSRVSAVDSDDELISDIINNSKYANSSSSSASKSNTDQHKKQQHLKSDKVKVSHSRVGDLYQALNIPPCRSADFSAPSIAVTQERPQLLSSATTTASTVLWDPSKAPKDSDIDELLVRLKLNKRGQQPRRPITHALVYTALAEANYDITAAEVALVPYGHTMKSSSSTNSHHELPTADTAATVTVSNSDSKSAVATKTSHSTTDTTIIAVTAATDAVPISQAEQQSTEQTSVADTTVSDSTTAATDATAARAVNDNTAVISSQPATTAKTDTVKAAAQSEQQHSSTEQLCTDYTTADSTSATAAASKDSMISADTVGATVPTSMDVDVEITPVVAAVAATTAVVPLAAAVPLHVIAVQQQSPVTDTIAATANDVKDISSAAPTAMDVDTTVDKPNDDDVKAAAIPTVTTAVTAAAVDTTNNGGGSSNSSVTAIVLRKSSKGKNKARLRAETNTPQTANGDSAHYSGSNSSSSTIDSSSTSSSAASGSAITVTGTVGHKLGIEYTNTANTMTSWTADERIRFVQEGLLVVGKDLSAIATMLGFKTRADVVDFYYNWKNQNESYKQWVEHRKLMSVEDIFPDSYPETCSGCNQHGDLLCCDSCNNAYHLECTRPQLKRVPEDGKHWICQECARVYPTGSNELKAAKRRIYRQRQKTEEHRQILRDCIARGDIDQLPDLISAIRSGARNVGGSSSSAGGSSSNRNRNRAASPISVAPAKTATTGSSASSGTSRTKAIAAKKDRVDNGNVDSDDDDSSTQQHQQQQPYVHKP